MLPAFSSPVKLSLPARMNLSGWRRITFICSACMMLLASCADIPDQDACIEIDAFKNDGKSFTIDTTIAYDTVASTIKCIVKYKGGSPATGWPVSFFIDSAEIRKTTDKEGRTSPLWVEAGNYSLGIGNPSEYPCILIHNLRIPGGRDCEITITLPTNE